MKAAVVESPGVLKVRQVPDPQVGEYDVLCRLLFGATCTGTDLHLIDGVFPWPPAYPAILGHESVGRVIEVGKKVRNFKIGDLVTRVGAPRLLSAGIDICWGGFAEYGLARDHWSMQNDRQPAGEWTGYRVNQIVPPGIDPRSATMIITWRETFSYLKRSRIDANNSLLVVGSGGNGMAYIAHAANLGVTPLVMLGSSAREEMAKRLGAEYYIDFRDQNWKQKLSAIRPAGFDFVIDAVGKQNSAQIALEQVRRNGVLGIYGVDDFGKPLLDPFRARGPFRFNPNEYDEAEAHAAVTDYIMAGRLEASAWMNLDHPTPLDQIAEAYASLRRKEHIKVLVEL